MARVRHPWEASYPAGVAWDTPIGRTTLPALLDEAVDRWGERPAINYRSRQISFRALGRLVDETAAGLLHLGIGAGETLALYLPNTPCHPVFLLGAAKAGARLAHLSPLDAERELLHKIRDGGARTLATTNVGSMLPMALKLLAAGEIQRIIVGDDAEWGPGPTTLTPIEADGERVLTLATLRAAGAASMPAAWPTLGVDDVALLQFTGGTTGVPKGAMLTHGNLTAGVSIYDVWHAGQGVTTAGEERVICVLPLFHIYALITILLRQICNGNEIFLRMRFDVETTLADIAERRASVFFGVPTMWIALAAHPGIERADLSSLRIASSGGAPLPVEVAQRIERLTGLRLGGGWGMTETCSAGTNLPILGGGPAGSIGLPLPGIEMRVVSVDDPTRVLPLGEVGELVIKGPNITQGYWDRAEESAEAFVDGFLRTGDIGRIAPDGYVFLVDRKKDMIISSGFNVYPRTIEDAIYEHPSVEEVIVIGAPDAYRGEVAKAFVKLRRDAARFTLEALREFLGDKIGRHELPAALEFREHLPRTSVGKLSKKELVEEERQRARDATAPALR